MKRVGDLEVDEDIGFEKSEWRAQRIGWSLMAVVILLALLGLFGTGPISSATAGAPDGPLLVEYQRFIRHDGRTSLRVQIDEEQIVDGQVELWISSEYLEDVEIEQFSQEPDKVTHGGERVIFTFLAANPTEPVSVTFAMQPQAMGRLSAAVGIVDGPEVQLSQLSYP